MNKLKQHTQTLTGIALMLCLLVATSCNDYLDKTPDDATSKTLDEIFASEIYTERFLLRAYDYLPCETNYNDNNYWALGAWSGASDEMNITWTYPMSKEMNRGSWNPGMLDGDSSQGSSYAMWWRYYEGIRQCNVFLENIEACPTSQENKTVWIGEARFLRAFLHFCLLRSHGPIPIMDRAIKMDDNLKHFPRNKFDDCVTFIVDDCQYGIDGALPIMYTNSNGIVADSKYGRATAAAALALKARTLLYAASPLFNGNPDYADYKNEDGTLLFSPRDDSKWEKAATAAKDCIDKVEGSLFYGLYYSSEPENGYRNYMELFLPSNKWNKEYIFGRNRGTGYDNNIHQERCFGSNGMGGWSGLCPTQELVDAFEMANGQIPILGYNANGTPIINTASGYSETGFAAQAGELYPAGTYNMYVNREPRFYATINFSGQQWRGRKLEFYQGGRDGINISKVDYCSTGYLLRKTADESVDLIAGTGGTKEACIYFRVGSLYLDYAEALNEAKGPVADVHTYMNRIRSRVGLPNLPAGLSKDEMRERIRRERRVELSFEAGHRYFDCHRWKIAEETDNGYVHGMTITAGESGYYKRAVVGDSRVFEKKHYLFPIPQGEMNKQIGLVQSPFWD